MSDLPRPATEFHNGTMNTVTENDTLNEQGDTTGYREISGLAVAGALVGALSIVALDHVNFLFIPVIAVIINWRALRAIRERPSTVLGRRAALAGLALALIFGFSGAALPLGREAANRRQAIDVAHYWFEALRDNQPAVAHQWTVARWKRLKEGDSIRAHYATDAGRKVLGRFLTEPAVHAVLNLGKASHVRYYGNVSSDSTDELRTIVDVYAVTVKNTQETTSFFVEVTVVARLDKMTKAWSWELNKSEFLTKPPLLANPPADEAAHARVATPDAALGLALARLARANRHEAPGSAIRY